MWYTHPVDSEWSHGCCKETGTFCNSNTSSSRKHGHMEPALSVGAWSVLMMGGDDDPGALWGPWLRASCWTARPLGNNLIISISGADTDEELVIDTETDRFSPVCVCVCVCVCV